jgi:DNA-binding FadR family transcriptional regulator
MRRGIVRGEFKPGDPLPNETELMALYDVSRPVVREALRILESEALIVIKRGVGGGARFTKPDVGVAAHHTAMLLQLEGVTLADLFEARATLEPSAVRRLVLQHDDRVIAQIRAMHDEERAVVDVPAQFATCATRFHAGLIELSGNKTLAVLARLLLEIVETHNRATIDRLKSQAPKVLRAASDWHGKLVDLIVAGDADAAETCWREHVEHAAQTALDRLGHATVVDILDSRF